jgi:hypothetical protein
MYPIIFSLALNSVKEHHGSFSGILCTGIIGGAIVPLSLVGWVIIGSSQRDALFIHHHGIYSEHWFLGQTDYYKQNNI